MCICRRCVVNMKITNLDNVDEILMLVMIYCPMDKTWSRLRNRTKKMCSHCSEIQLHTYTRAELPAQLVSGESTMGNVVCSWNAHIKDVRDA